MNDMSPDQLLATFLDACRDGDTDSACGAIHELRFKVWVGTSLPRDVRPDPEELAQLRREAAMWRNFSTHSFAERVRDPGKGFHALRSEVTAVHIEPEWVSTPITPASPTIRFPFCIDPAACATNGGRCPRDPVCGN